MATIQEKRVFREMKGQKGRPPQKTQVGGGLEPIQEIIERLVKERVGAALCRVIAELERVRG